MNPIFERIGKCVEDNLPKILTAAAIGGAIGTTLFAVNATRKAVKAVESKEAEKQEPLTKKEVVKETWKYYVPTAISLGLTVASCACAQHENTKRNAIVTAALTMSETALHELKETTREVIGEKKAEEIENKAAIKHAETVVQEKPEVLSDCEFTGHGNARFMDGFGRTFYCSTNWIDHCLNELDNRMGAGQDEYCNWNDLLYLLGLQTTEFGEFLGWNSLRDGSLYQNRKYVPVLSEDGNQTLILTFRTPPHSNYTRWDALID